MIKQNILFIVLVLFTSCIFAQETDEFTGLDLKKVAEKHEWKPAKQFKGVNSEKMDLFFLELNSDYALIKQININSWSVCYYQKTDNWELYNYYYEDITKATYNLYCKEFNALMLIDGVIKQQK